MKYPKGRIFTPIVRTYGRHKSVKIRQLRKTLGIVVKDTALVDKCFKTVSTS